MNSPDQAAGEHRRALGDVAVLCAAFGVAMLARTFDSAATVAIATVAVPVVVFATTGYLPGRGAASGCLALAFGAAIGPAGGQSDPTWAEASVLALMGMVAAGAGRLASVRPAAAEPEAEIEPGIAGVAAAEAGAWVANAPAASAGAHRPRVARSNRRGVRRRHAPGAARG